MKDRDVKVPFMGFVAACLEDRSPERVLVVVATPERRREVLGQLRAKGRAPRVVTPGAPMYGERYDRVITELNGSDAPEAWLEHMTCRLAPMGAWVSFQPEA